MQVKQIISKLGGIRPTATKLGVGVSTVQGWKERNHIPIGRRQSIENILGQGIFTDNLNHNTKNQNHKNDTESTKSTKIQNKENDKKLTKNTKNINFLLYFSLFFSVLALGLSITTDLWRGILFPQIDNITKIQTEIKQIQQKVILITEKTAKTNENSQKSLLQTQSFVNEASNYIDNIKQTTEQNANEIKNNSNKLNSILESGNEKVIKVRQIITIALSGEDFSLLLKGISSDNSKTQQALTVLDLNKSGIYTKQMLLNYINDNILELSQDINYKNATTAWEKIKAKINGAIYIRWQDKDKKDTISRIIESVKKDDFNNIITLLNGVNSHSTNKLKQLIVNRQQTLIALDVLNNWALQE